jgi:hypothetical protein
VHADLLISLQVSIEIKRHIGAVEFFEVDEHDLAGVPGELLYQRKPAVFCQVKKIETSLKIFNPVGGVDAVELRVAYAEGERVVIIKAEGISGHRIFARAADEQVIARVAIQVVITIATVELVAADQIVATVQIISILASFQGINAVDRRRDDPLPGRRL